jgi:Cu/Ag efflux protein CusF
MQIFKFRRRVQLVMAASAATMTAIAPIAAFDAARAAGAIMVAQAEKPAGQGTLNSVDAKAPKLNVTHGPIAGLKWPGMTMDFSVAPGVDLVGLKPGSKIAFTLSRGADGTYVIDEIKLAE